MPFSEGHCWLYFTNKDSGSYLLQRRIVCRDDHLYTVIHFLKCSCIYLSTLTLNWQVLSMDLFDNTALYAIRPSSYILQLMSKYISFRFTPPYIRAKGACLSSIVYISVYLCISSVTMRSDQTSERTILCTRERGCDSWASFPHDTQLLYNYVRLSFSATYLQELKRLILCKMTCRASFKTFFLGSIAINSKESSWV